MVKVITSFWRVLAIGGCWRSYVLRRSWRNGVMPKLLPVCQARPAVPCQPSGKAEPCSQQKARSRRLSATTMRRCSCGSNSATVTWKRSDGAVLLSAIEETDRAQLQQVRDRRRVARHEKALAGTNVKANRNRQSVRPVEKS